MATNRPTTRRRSAKQAFEDDDAPVIKRAKTTDVNGAAKRSNGATKRTAKAAYDEDDDGFQFSRRTSRRTAAKAPAAEPIPEDEPAKPAPARRKKSSVVPPDPVPEEPSTRRRSARLSGDNEQLAVQRPEPAKPLAKRTKKAAPTEEKRRKQVASAPVPDPQPGVDSDDKVAVVGAQTVQTPKTDLHVSKKRDGGATKIMLPFADTPVITRNKEMRKGNKDGHRRSSTGLRGRRASSLIDSGLSNALPHSETEVREYYKYIEQSLPEPRRMKQLLIWCGSRALPEKPSGDVPNANAIMAARAIQQELIDDFSSKPDISDWFSREESAPKTVIKKPNPQNIRNEAALKELEEEVKRLEEEKAAWDALASSSTLMPPPPVPTLSTPHPTLSDIDLSLLDPSQASILSALRSRPPEATVSSDPTSTEALPASSSSAPFTFTTSAALQNHLSKLSLALEPNIDLFADGVHKIEQYRNTAERVADRILGTAAARLEERDKAGKASAGTSGIGTGDVLRGLAGVLGDR